MEILTLEELIAWILSGGGAGVLTYFLMDKVKFLRELASDYKRYASLALAAILALVAWGAGMGMSYLAVPVGWRAWIEAAFSIIALALASSGILHGAIDLRKKRLRGS